MKSVEVPENMRLCEGLLKQILKTCLKDQIIFSSDILSNSYE